MTERENEETLPTRKEYFEMLTRFEECVCDAFTLNSALMILIGHEKFNDLNYELLLHILGRLTDAKQKIKEGYELKSRMKEKTAPETPS